MRLSEDRSFLLVSYCLSEGIIVVEVILLLNMGGVPVACMWKVVSILFVSRKRILERFWDLAVTPRANAPAGFMLQGLKDIPLKLCTAAYIIPTRVGNY